jgi:hypothetical protein
MATAPPPTCPPVAVATTSIEVYYGDDSKIPPAKKNSYIVMIAPSAIPGFDVNKIHPYSKFKDVKGFKGLFKHSKEMIALEARRRDPSIRMNSNNRSNQEMMAELTLLGHLLTQEDREFVIRKECEMRAILLGQLTLMSDPTAVRQVWTSAARLRLAAAIGLENNLLLFKRSQDCSTRVELDRGTSPKGILMEALAVTFNDKNWVAEIQAMPELHDDFQEAIKIGHMSDFTMTAAKVAEILQTRKLEIRKISNDFSLSGNGEDMLGFAEEDGDDIMDGGKRSAFLRGKPSDLLYWWYIYEQNDLMAMTFAEFGSNAVDGATETPISNKRKKPSKSEVGASKQAGEIETLSFQLIEANRSSYTDQIIKLKESRYLLRRDMRVFKKDCGAEFEESDEDWQYMLQRMKELDDDIAQGELDVVKCEKTHAALAAATKATAPARRLVRNIFSNKCSS